MKRRPKRERPVLVSRSGVVRHWGAHTNARRVSYLTPQKRKLVQRGGLVLLYGPPVHLRRDAWTTFRKVVKRGDRYYTRVPSVEELQDARIAGVPVHLYVGTYRSLCE